MDDRGAYMLEQSDESQSQPLSGSWHSYFPKGGGQCPVIPSSLFHTCFVRHSVLKAIHRGVSGTA